MQLNFAMPYGFQDMLDRKYAIQAQDVSARANAANADANLTNVRAKLLPTESAANVGLTKAQTGLAGAQTDSVKENTKFVAPLARASIFNTTAQGSLYGQQAIGEFQLNRLSPTMAGGKAKPGATGMPAWGAAFDSRLNSLLRGGMYYGGGADDE